MRGHALNAPPRCVASALQLEREHELRELRLAIGRERLVFPLKLQIAKIKLSIPIRDAGYVDDTGVQAAPQQRKQMRGQGEMPEIVDAKLKLEAVGGDAPRRWRHHAGIINQEVETFIACVHALPKGSDRTQVGKIYLLKYHRGLRGFPFYFRDRQYSFRKVSPSNDHRPAGLRQGKSGLKAKPSSTRHYSAAASLPHFVLDASINHRDTSLLKYYTMCNIYIALGVILQVGLFVQESGMVGEKQMTEGIRERKRRETLARIAETGLRLFMAKGYENTTLEEIAEAAGISRRTFFYYFKSKEEIILVWQTASVEYIRSAVLAQSSDQTPLEAVKNALLKLTAGYESDENIVIDRMIRASEALQARTQSKYLAQEQAVFEALCEKWPQAKRRKHLRIVAMTAIGAFRLAIEAWSNEDGKRPVSAYLRESFAHLNAAL